jgi:hypothetical protein
MTFLSLTAFVMAFINIAAILAWMHPETVDKHRRKQMFIRHGLMLAGWVILGVIALVLS